MTPAEADELARVERMADWLDSRFRVPGTDLRFGLDGVLGLIPGAGDLGTAAIAAWTLGAAHRVGAPPGVMARMALNIGIDAVIGAIPVVGDVFDLGFKSNRRNAALLRRYLEAAPPPRP